MPDGEPITYLITMCNRFMSPDAIMFIDYTHAGESHPGSVW